MAKISSDNQQTRRVEILDAARWCFLNFGFAKTSLDDIAKRANISRTLLYRTYKNKEDIFKAVFRHWLMAHLPEAETAAARKGDPYQRLLDVCRIVVVDPWNEMYGAPMAHEFFDSCARIDEETSTLHRQTAIACFAKIFGDQAAADVFVLSLDGLLGDKPQTEVLAARVKLLAARFAPLSPNRK